MRALLVVNPHATATTPRGRDVLIRALGSDLKLDVAETTHRGHAIELAEQAVADGLDVVLTLGGDGTVNEVVNGLLRDGPSAAAPALAVVPGGSTNVFTRAVGGAADPVDATSELLDALRSGRTRRIGLGRAAERWFTFTAGLGIDAQAVRAVERRRRRGRRSTPGLYIRSALVEYFRHTDRRHPALTLRRPGEEPVEGLYVGIVGNTSPWTYLGSRPVVTTPQASFDTGLDLFTMRRLGPVAMARVSLGMLSSRRPGPHGRAATVYHDLAEFTLVADRPQAFQVDGDYLGERTEVTFTAVPQALRLVI